MYLWDAESVIYYDFFQSSETVHVKRYSHQLNDSADKIEEKSPFTRHGNRKVILLHDSARPYITQIIQQTIINLG